MRSGWVNEETVRNLPVNACETKTSSGDELDKNGNIFTTTASKLNTARTEPGANTNRKALTVNVEDTNSPVHQFTNHHLL